MRAALQLHTTLDFTLDFFCLSPYGFIVFNDYDRMRYEFTSMLPCYVGYVINAIETGTNN